MANLPFEGLTVCVFLSDAWHVSVCCFGSSQHGHRRRLQKTCATSIDAMSRLGPKKMPCWSWFPLVNQVCACADMRKCCPLLWFLVFMQKRRCAMLLPPPEAKAFRFFRRNAYIQMHQTTQSCVHSNNPLAISPMYNLGSLADSWSCWLLWCVACSFDVHVCAVLRRGCHYTNYTWLNERDTWSVLIPQQSCDCCLPRFSFLDGALLLSKCSRNCLGAKLYSASDAGGTYCPWWNLVAAWRRVSE